MKIILRRHSITLDNLQKRYSGLKSDPPLAPIGAELAARQPDARVKKVYTSHLQRTQQTAALLYPRAEQIAVPDLAEMDFGIFEGKNWQELQGDAAYQIWLDSHCQAPCPGGESREEFSARILAAFLQVLQPFQGAGGREEALYFVLHGGTIMALCAALAYPRQEFFHWHIKPCGGYQGRFTWGEHQPRQPRLIKLASCI